MFDRYIDQMRPHAKRIGDRAEALACRAVATLDMIEENTREEAWHETVQRLNFNFSGAGAVDLFNLRVADHAKVENVVADAAVGALTITQSGQLRIAANFTGADTKSWGDAGPELRGEDGIPTISVGAAGNVYVQVRLKRRAPARTTRDSGIPEHQPNGTDPRQDDQMHGRHTTPLHQMPNIMGARKG